MAEKIKDKLRILHKRVLKDLDKNINPKKCNDHIKDFDSLKEELDEMDHNWIENFEDIEEVSESGIFSSDADEDEIHETLEEILHQLERIFGRLGIDLEEESQVKPSSKPISPVTVNFSPNMTQQVKTSTNIQIETKQEVNKLVREFEEEHNKPSPDKSKLKKIIEKLKTLGPYALPYVEKILLKFGNWFL